MRLNVVILLTIICLINFNLLGQTTSLEITLKSDNIPIEKALITCLETNEFYISDANGKVVIENLKLEKITLQIEKENFETHLEEFIIDENLKSIPIELFPKEFTNQLNEVVISGTMKPVSRLESPVAVEVFTSQYFKKNPTPNLFDALQSVNGVRPQLNCNVCNTGDIHTNGLEGPYTMVLVDGMPIMSSLGTVYGLAGIPNSLVDRIEVIKGPASTLYGSEAVGGLINIITKHPKQAPIFSIDAMTTTWLEHNLDIGFKLKLGSKIDVLTGINYFNYQNIEDKNHDNFTDVTLQDRISIFQKWNFQRYEARIFTIAARYLYEDRWGGDIRWNKSYRGGNEIYGESIYTNRLELLGNYQLPFSEKMFLGFSWIDHQQDSRYGETSYIADQRIIFGQLTWQKDWNKNEFLAGIALRNTYYDDNTPATIDIEEKNQPENVLLPGIFLQNEIKFNEKHRFLAGIRYDYHKHHGNIITPRIAYKWSFNPTQTLRINAGNGYRIVNLFTEDHAALTGAREVMINDNLKPEKSYNANLNYTHLIKTSNQTFINLDATLFFTYFNNRILPDYETDPNKILYDNLDGHAISKGLSLALDINFSNGIKLNSGITWMENTLHKEDEIEEPLLTEKFAGNWALSYKIKPLHINVDYTGNVYSPMKLPTLGELDPRSDKSPWWSNHNIQFTYQGKRNLELYGGIKNIFNWTPSKHAPFLIARAHDPFDNLVEFDPNGNVIPTAENPYGLTFDPSYIYAPNQGIRLFLGVRYLIR